MERGRRSLSPPGINVRTKPPKDGRSQRKIEQDKKDRVAQIAILSEHEALSSEYKNRRESQKLGRNLNYLAQTGKISEAINLISKSEYVDEFNLAGFINTLQKEKLSLSDDQLKKIINKANKIPFNKAMNIANFINGLAHIRLGKSTVKEILNLDNLNQLIKNQINNFKPIEIANTLNGLAQLGYNKKDLRGLEISRVMKRINEINYFEPTHIANTLNGLAQLGYNKDDLIGLEISRVMKRINEEINNFKPIEIANTLNGLAQLGYNKDDLIGLEISRVMKRINEEINNFKPINIANTLNSLAQLGYNKDDLIGLEISRVMERINEEINNFKPIEIANTLNGLAQLGYNKDDLRDLYIVPVMERISEKINNFESRHIANTLNGLAQLGYNRDDLGDFKIVPVMERINEEINNFKPIEIANTLNGLAQLGYNKGDFIDFDISRVMERINRKINDFEPRHFANTLNGLVKIGFVDEIFLIQETINKFLDSILKNNINSGHAFSILEANMISSVIHGKEILEPEIRSKLANIAKYHSETSSSLESKVKENFSRIEGVSIKDDDNCLYEVDGAKIRNVDIVIEYKEKKFFIEVDGPWHFRAFNHKGEYHLIPTEATIRRDHLNTKLIEQKGGGYYLIIPCYNIDELNSHEEIQKYLLDRLEKPGAYIVREDVEMREEGASDIVDVEMREDTSDMKSVPQNIVSEPRAPASLPTSKHHGSDR